MVIVQWEGSDLTNFTREDLKDILEGELYRKFLHRVLPIEQAVTNYGFEISKDETKYRAFLMFNQVLFYLQGSLEKKNDKIRIQSIHLSFLKLKTSEDKKQEASQNRMNSEQGNNEIPAQIPFIQEEKQNEKEAIEQPIEPEKKEIVGQQKVSPSNSNDLFTYEKYKKVSQKVIRVWIHLTNQKVRLLQMNRKDFSVITYSRYMDTKKEDREYPVIYEADKKFRVVFQDGTSEDFYTEFCAKVYAILHPSRQDVQIMQDIRVLDGENQAKEKIKEFLNLLVSEKGEDYTKMVKALNLIGMNYLTGKDSSDSEKQEESDNTQVLQSQAIANIDLVHSDEE